MLMKLFLSLLFLLSFTQVISGSSSPANTHLLKNTTIEELKVEKMPLDEVIDLLREQTKQGVREVNFVLAPETKANERWVTLDLRGVKGIDALSMILQQTQTRAELKRNSIWILPNP